MAANERKTETLRGKIEQAQERMGQADPSDYVKLGEIQAEIEPYIMARIVDFEEFIRQYPFDIISIHDDLHFIIDDPIMECNCGDFSLRWDAAGNTILERGGTRGETVRCDIQTLTAMFYGYKRPTYLKRVERLQANDTAVRILEDIIPIEQPYFSDYF